MNGNGGGYVLVKDNASVFIIIFSSDHCMMASPSDKYSAKRKHVKRAVGSLLCIFLLMVIGISLDPVQARDLPKYLIAGYRLIPYFIFNATEGSRSTLFATTDPQVPEYCGVLKADEWPVCPYISFDCRPMNPSEESHDLQTSQEVWEKTLEMVGLPSDSFEKLI